MRNPFRRSQEKIGEKLLRDFGSDQRGLKPEERLTEEQLTRILEVRGEDAAVDALQTHAALELLTMGKHHRLSDAEVEYVIAGYQAFAFKLFKEHYLRKGMTGEAPKVEAGKRTDAVMAGITPRTISIEKQRGGTP